MGEQRYITFLSDYGLTDEFVGICHGVMLSICPDVRIIDLTHGISPQEVREGAMVLGQSVPYLPVGVHLGIVDPSVGSDRMAIAIQTRQGSYLVGPDNGLLTLALDQLGGSVACHQISNEKLILDNPSKTFQGRDIFAPAAAHLAAGVPIEEFGPPVPTDSLVALDIPKPRLHDDHYHAVVLHVDRFGNLQLNLTEKEMREIGLPPGSMMEVRIEGHRKLVPYGQTFSSVPPGEIVLTEDSYRLLAVSINRANAAYLLGARMGSTVIIGPPGSGAAD